MLQLPGRVKTSSFSRKAALKIGTCEEVAVVQHTAQPLAAQAVLEHRGSAVDVGKPWRRGEALDRARTSEQLHMFLTSVLKGCSHFSSDVRISPVHALGESRLQSFCGFIIAEESQTHLVIFSRLH